MLKQKKITIFTILIMVFNFIAPNTMIIANALENNEVQKTISSVETTISNTNKFITQTKEDASYETDKSTKVALDYLERSFNKEVEKFNSIKSELENGVNLSELIKFANNEELTKNYEKYVESGNTIKTISIDNISDIKFTYVENNEELDEDPNTETEITLLTSTDIENLIIAKYLRDISTINNYNSDLLNSLKSNYTELVNNINAKKEEITTKVSEINEYEQSELLKNNNPDMLIDNVNVYDLYEEYTSSLEALISKIDLSNTEDINNELSTITSNITSSYKKFFENNKDFTTYSNEINALKEKYNTNINKYKEYLSDKTLDNIDISNIDSTFIDITNEFKALNEEYNLLKDNIDKYLTRKPSEQEEVTKALKDLSELADEYKSTIFTDKLEAIANNATTEDQIDLLLTSKLLSEETQEKLFNKKLSFYEFKLKENSEYKMNILDKILLLSNVKEFNLTNFKNDIEYNFKYNAELNDEDKKFYITLQDKNEKELIKYEILLKNDLNNDYKLDNDDVELLKTLITTTYEDNTILLNDFNNDNKLNIKDVTDLDNYINDSYDDSSDITSKFRINKKVENNTVTYEVYLNTNGVINGFSFDLETNSDLIFDKYISEYNLTLDNTINPTKIVGVGTFTNDVLLVKLVYNLNDNYTKTSFNLNNGIIINSNGVINDNLTNFDIIEKVTPEEDKTSNNTKTVSNETNNEELDSVDEDIIIDNDSDKEEDTTTDTEGTDKKSEDKLSISTVIKVVLVILLGTLLIYFLNKSDEKESKEEETKEFLKKEEKPKTKNKTKK